MNHPVHFREDQHFNPWLVGTALFTLLVVGLVLLYFPATRLGGIIVLATGGGVALMLAVLKLVTEVRDDGLYVRLFPLWFRRFGFEQIESCTVRTYRPILEYGGWGLRLGPAGWAYNARGNRGVQLVLRSGRRVLIGSQRCEELAAALAAGMATEETKQ